MNKIIKRFIAAMVSITLFISSALPVSAKTLTASYSISGAEVVTKIDTADVFKARDLNAEWDDATATKVVFNDYDITVNGTGATVAGSVLTITDAGTYVLSGTLSDGQIFIKDADTEKTAKIQIVLNGVSIKCSDGAPICVAAVDKVYITVAAGTVNTVTDSSMRTDTKQDAAIFSKDDMTINGSGTLNVTGNYKVGIHSENDLKVCGTVLNVDSSVSANSGHALRGEDLVALKDAQVTLKAANDGIQSDNTEAGKGNVIIEGGKINITSTGDGVQAEHALQISGGNIEIATDDGDGFKAVDSVYIDGTPNVKMNVAGDGIKTDFIYDATLLTEGGNIQINNGSFEITAQKDGIQAASETAEAADANASVQILGGEFDINSASGDGIKATKSIEIGGGNFDIGASSDGIHCENSADTTVGSVIISGGDFTITAVCDAIQAEVLLSVSGGTFNIKTTGTPSDATATSDGTSCKGLKAASTIEISGGEFTITSTDDSIHSNDTVVISNNPVIKITSNDDGIHADDSITVNGGDITITKSYEGIEAMFIEFNGGNVNITANDDGVNAAGGTDNSSMGRPGENSFDSTAGNKGLSITGGNIVVNAQGDGLDSNGNINVTGGTTVVYGPSGGGNGSFDYDGSATVSGGTVVAVGTSDMAQNFGSASTQCSILMKFNSSKSANTAIGLFDSNGNSIIGITTKKTTGCILVTAPQMTANQSYTFKTGGSVIGAVNGFAQGEGCYEGGTVICTTMPTNNIWNINESGMSTGDSGGMPGGSGGTRPTRRPQNTPGTTQTVSYTVEQVVSIMEQVEKQYEADGAIPMSVNDGISGTLNKASYFRLACMAVVNINSGNTSAAIQYKSFIEPQGIENDVFDYETISKAGYLDAAMRVVEYCDSRNAVPGSLPYPGQNNIEEYNGTLSYERAVGIMMKVLAYYGENRTLPESVEVALIGDATPTPQTTPTPDATPAVSPTATPSETVIPTETPDTTPTATPDNTPSSEEIVLAENSEYVIDRENTLLTNVSSSTTVLAFEENIEGEILIFDEQDNQITDKTAVIGTGYKLKLMDESGTVKDELTISVMGDLNGDGKENSRDIAALQKQLLSGDVVSAFVFAAADVKADAKINSRDIAELQKKILFG